MVRTAIRYLIIAAALAAALVDTAYSDDAGRKALRELAARYSALDAYASRTSCRFLNGTPREVLAENEAEFVLRYRQGRFDLEPFLLVNLYGEPDRFVVHSRHVNRYRNYSRREVGSWRDAIFFPTFFLDSLHPALGLLLDETGRDPLLANLEDVSVSADGSTLSLEMRLEGNPNQSEYRLTWRIDPQSGLLAGSSFDFRPGRAPTSGAGLMAGDCEIVRLDATDEANHPRGFAPDANDRLVEPGEFPEDLRIDAEDDGSFRALVGRPAPEFTATKLGGGEVTLADLRGKVVVLDFWATWCANCALSWRHLEEVEESFEGVRDVVFYGVNLDRDDLQGIRDYLRTFAIHTPQLLDPNGEMAGDYRALGTPAFVVIGPEGRVAAVMAGQSPSLAERLIQAIDEAGVARAAARQESDDPREPAALEIMKRADAALAAAGTLEYDFERTGTFTASGRTTGHAIVERSDGFAGMRYRGSISSHVAPRSMRRVGREVEIASDGETVWLLDHDDRTLQVGSRAGGAGVLILPAGQIMMPLMFRPLHSVEIELAERMFLAGTAEVGGVECDVVYLDFPDDSGLGEQYFYVGRRDHLPRRIVLVTDANDVINQFDFVMTDLRVVEPTADTFRLAAPAGYAVDDEVLDVAPGAVAEGWEMTTADGEAVRLQDLRGKVVVLDFFASWCPYCRRQLPMVSEVARELEGQPVEFFGVNAWETGDPLAFLEEIGAEIPVLLEGDDLARQYRIESTATLIIIDPEGRFLPRQLGTTTRAALLKAIRKTLPSGGESAE